MNINTLNINKITMLVARKTFKCKIIGLTNIKRKQLEIEYSNLQDFLQISKIFWWDKKLGLKIYSANKQQALRFYKTIKKDKEYPISIRKDLIDIKETKNKLAKYWVKIPIKSRYGGLKLAIKPHQDFPKNHEICESKLFRKNNEFWIHITIQKKIEENKSYFSILAIDLGEKNYVTSVSVAQNGIQRVKFYGKEIRGIRRRYQYLRKKLGEKKLLKKIKEIGQKEKRIVNQKLHEISKTIVDLATSTNSLIVLGDLKEIRKSLKGKKFNRILNNWAYYKLTKYIEYKARWKGIKVVKICEKGTSYTCYRCGHKGKRPKQAVFNCPNCDLKDFNADINGAINIAKKFLFRYILDRGVVNEPALNLTIMKEPLPLVSSGVSRETLIVKIE